MQALPQNSTIQNITHKNYLTTNIHACTCTFIKKMKKKNNRSIRKSLVFEFTGTEWFSTLNLQEMLNIFTEKILY